MTRPDIQAGRLSAAEIAENFSDIHPPLRRSEALIEADRCYFCFDAPCTTACPTGIDIPQFIQKIRSDNREGSAITILTENIMGGMCARVCPTEVLCEEACVRNDHEHQPVRIGLLQRYATDTVIDHNLQPFRRGKDTGKTVAIVGGGPAGLACAHRLATLGHKAVVLNRDEKPGGLNEYGIAAYKTPDNFAQREVDWILGIGGIEVRCGESLGSEFTLASLRLDYDAVFLGVGLGGVNKLGIEGEDNHGVRNAVDFIAQLRQAPDKSTLPVGRRVIVIGGGMTAIDVAVQSKRLGSERVDIVYRRGPGQMGASRCEQDFAQSCGVAIRHWSAPIGIVSDQGVLTVTFARTAADNQGRLMETGETWQAEADVVYKAVGQLLGDDLGKQVDGSFDMRNGRLVVDSERRTSIAGVWAGGDCVHGNDDLTVSAVQDGKVAAHSIDRFLRDGASSDG